MHVPLVERQSGVSNYMIFLGDDIDLSYGNMFYLTIDERGSDGNKTGNLFESARFAMSPRSSDATGVVIAINPQTLTAAPQTVTADTRTESAGPSTIVATASATSEAAQSSSATLSTATDAGNAANASTVGSGTSLINGFSSITSKSSGSSVTNSASAQLDATPSAPASSDPPASSSQSAQNSRVEIGVGLGVGLLGAVGLASLTVCLLARLRRRQQARSRRIDKQHIRVIRPKSLAEDGSGKLSLRELAERRTVRELEAARRARSSMAAEWDSGVVLEARESLSDSGWWNVVAPTLWRDADGRSTRSK